MNYLNIETNKVLPVAEELNKLLADYHLYYQKLRNFHWNITGANFFVLHEKFEEMYIDARDKIDEIAERILTLQYHPMSSYSDYLNTTNISEVSHAKTDFEMVENILKTHKIILKQLATIIEKASDAKDEGTIDLIGGYIASLEKKSWQLNVWLKSTKAQLKQDLVM